ncbi:hypothetical protein BGW39_010068 [Mortierella sp. 14UC]|nr:hypothetical protein BGW39_010068 [Mortierella sp. 14UC]
MPDSQPSTRTYVALSPLLLPRLTPPSSLSGSSISGSSSAGPSRLHQSMQKQSKGKDKKVKSSTPVVRSKREIKFREDWFNLSYYLRSSLEVYKEYGRYFAADAERSKLPNKQRTLLLRKTSKQLNLRAVFVNEIVYLKRRTLSESGHLGHPTSPSTDSALVETCQELDRLVKMQLNPKTGRPWNKFTTNRAITFCRQQQVERERSHPSGSNRVESESESKSESEEIGDSESEAGDESGTGEDSEEDEEEDG